MKFYGIGKVWDKEKETVLCEFIDGELETTNQRVIKILKEIGFKFNGEIVEVIKDLSTETPMPRRRPVSQISAEEV